MITDKSTLLRQLSGPLTNELLLGPGSFGLGKVPNLILPDATTRSTCGFCSTGCSLDIHLKDGQAVNLSPTLQHSVNLGMACPKGWEALSCLKAPDRATSPLMRQEDGSMQPVTWDKAMRTFVAKFRATIKKHGNESVAFLSTGQICTEELALLGALWKFGIGAIHCDSNTRQCMATANVAYKQSLGFDAPPFTYADFEESDTLIFVGANPCIAHPIMWQRVMRNTKKPKIIVIDPRRTETASYATQHLALRPKTDLTLLYGVANILIQNGWMDTPFIEHHTNGFEEFASFVRDYTPSHVAKETGLPISAIHQLAESIHTGRAVSFWWTMGVNQSHEATRTAQAIINLALMTGNIGRPGTGANSITGQCNAMGSRMYSNVTSLPAGRDFLNAEDREEVAEILNIPLEKIPSVNSLAYDQILDRVRDGRIKALWIIATNPNHSWIGRGNPGKSGEGLFDKLDFLVVQDMFTTTDSALQADLLLPAAGWGEKDGTFINSERRISLTKKVSRAPGQALSDFNIFTLVGNYWGCGEMLSQWTSPEAVFQIMKKLSKGTPCDITGIRDYLHLDAAGGIQWPWSEAAASAPSTNGEVEIPGLPPQERRLFADGTFFHKDGRAKFLFEQTRPAGELADEAYPFALLTGRGTSAQWHTNTRTGKSDVLRTLYPQNAYVEMNHADARRLGIVPNSRVAVSSRRGSIVCTAVTGTSVQEGQLFIPMHYEEANRLTFAEFDPYSRQPSYKHCAVRIEAVQP
jgi:assimilatory nitrate reductase catalytic subunit